MQVLHWPCIDESGDISKIAMDIIGILDSSEETTPSGIGIHNLFFANALITEGDYKKNSHNSI